MANVTFQDFLNGFQPKSPAEKEFVEKHTIQLIPLPGEGSEEDKRNKANNVGTYEGTPHVVNAFSTAVFNRSEHRMGYNPGEDKNAYLQDPTARGIQPNEDLQVEIDKILNEDKSATLLKHNSGKFSVMVGDKHLDHLGLLIPKNGMVHSVDWKGIAFDSEQKAKDNAKKHGYNINKILENEEYDLLIISEHLSPSMGVHKYIDDFVHSSNPRFVGKSKEERIKSALAAFYAAKKSHGMNEDVLNENINKKHPQSSKKIEKKEIKESVKEMFLEAVQLPLDEQSFNLNPAKKGMFKGKSLSDIKSNLAKLKKSGPHPKGSTAATKEHEDIFAINAKSGAFRKK